jgi:hypothetical protein
MSITRNVNIGKSPVVLACAIGVLAVNGAVLEAQPISQIEDEQIAESVLEVPSEKEEAEVVFDESALRWIEFHSLAKQWREERGAQSTVAALAMLPSYQKIIGMGPAAVPLILAQLKSEGNSPSHWFWALASITRANPVPQNSRGKLQEMAKAWLAWGEKQGYV